MRKHFQLSKMHFFSMFSLDLVFSRYVNFFLVFFFSISDLIVRKDEERMRRLGIFGIFSFHFLFWCFGCRKN